VATETHDLENWCMHGVICLQHGMCVELGGALGVLPWIACGAGWQWQ